MHEKDSTFKMNLKFQYYFHFFEIQFKIQDLRLYYSTTHLKYTYIFLVTRVSFFPEQTTYIISITVLYKNNMVIPMLAFYLHANIHCCWRVSKRKLMSYVMFFFKAYQHVCMQFRVKLVCIEKNIYIQVLYYISNKYTAYRQSPKPFKLKCIHSIKTISWVQRMYWSSKNSYIRT